jgi:hypothetical protein
LTPDCFLFFSLSLATDKTKTTKNNRKTVFSKDRPKNKKQKDREKRRERTKDTKTGRGKGRGPKGGERRKELGFGGFCFFNQTQDLGKEERKKK